MFGLVASQLLLMDGRWGDGYGHRGHWIGMLIMGLVLIAAVVAIVWAIRRPDHRPSHGGAPVPPPPGAVNSAQAINILRERFARGEINEEEFTKKLTLLS
jgi:putative membrane protein